MGSKYLEVFNKADRWRFFIITVCFLFYLIISPLSPLTVDWESFRWLFVGGLVLLLIGIIYSSLNRNIYDQRLSRISIIFSQAVIFSNIAAIDNYLGFYFKRPLFDNYLAAVDAAFGLDWILYLKWLKSEKTISLFMSLAYISTGPQVMLVLIFLSVLDRRLELDIFSLACMVSAFITVAIWMLFPTFGPAVTAYAQGSAIDHFDLVTSKEYALRLISFYSGASSILHVSDVVGLIAFPSFHTVLATLTVYGVWGLPRLRFIAIVVNLLVLLSIPADGGHYFVDLMGGLLVAGVSIGLARIILRSSAA